MEKLMKQKKLNEDRMKKLKKETDNIIYLAGYVSVPVKNSKLSSEEINKKILKFNKNSNAKLSPLEKNKKNVLNKVINDDLIDFNRKHKRLSPISENPIILEDSIETKKSKSVIENQNFKKLAPLKNNSKSKNFTKIQDELINKNIRKSSVFENYYVIKHKTASTENIDQMKRSRFFSKKHIFDVYLDDSLRCKKEILHPLINEFNETNRPLVVSKI